MADLQTVKIRDLIETTQVMTTDYMVLEKDTGTFKCQARYLKGATGLTPNVQVGNTNTLAPGQLATVTQRGNTENPVFDFGIPQGVQGKIGPQGPKGDTPDITPLQTQIDNRFNALTSQQQGSSEVIDARGGYPALKARLDAINDDLIKYNDQTIVTHTTESNFSSIDSTKNGYLDNILLEGKTLVVDSNNQVVLPGTQGAMLKSVGDDVTEIKLKSLYKNLFDESNLNITKNNIDGVLSYTLKGTSNSTVNNTILSDNTIKGRLSFSCISKKTQYFNDFTVKYTDGTANSYRFTNDNFSLISFTTLPNKDVKEIVLDTGSDTALGYIKVGSIMINYGNVVEQYSKFISNNKKVLYKDTDGTWKKPTLRKWDSVEKHSDGKYYYHKRSGNRKISSNDDIRLSNISDDNYIRFQLQIVEMDGNRNPIISNLFKLKTNYDIGIGEGLFTSISGNTLYIDILKSKLNSNDVNGFKGWLDNNDMNIVFKLSSIEVFDCAPLDLISYDSQTNYIIECGPIYPKTTLKVNSYLGNVVSILKDKVSYLENMLVDGLKLVVAGNMQELAYQLYPQDFVSNVDKEVIK